MSRATTLVGITLILISLVATGCAGIKTQDERQPEVVKSFNVENSELPEGIIIDKDGNIYVSVGPPFFVGGGYGALWKISSDGREAEMLYEFPDGPAPAGVAVDTPGNVFFALPNPGGEGGGVYHLTGDGGTKKLPGTENIVLPNGLAIDKQSNIFVSDSVMGAVWRLPSDGTSPAEIWIQHDLLAGCPEDIGANGVAFWGSNLYAANTSKGLLVRIPISPDGAPGEPEIIAGNDDCEEEELFGMDGIALDEDGNVYALLVLQNKLVKIDPIDGSFTTLLTGEDGLWNPASIAFGTQNGERKNVFIANYAVIPPGSDIFGPAVLKYDVGVSGLPLP